MSIDSMSGEGKIEEAVDVIRQVAPQDATLLQDARDVEASVFIEKQYVETEDELAEEYSPYEQATTFVVVENAGEVVGATRIIANNPNGFKTLNDARLGKLEISADGEEMLQSTDLSRTAEIGTIAVKKEFRGRHEARAAVKLYGAILAYCRENDINTLIASMDDHYFSTFKQIFGEAVQQLGPMKDYMGSPTIPLIMDPYKMHENTKELSQELYDQIEAASKSVV